MHLVSSVCIVTVCLFLGCSVANAPCLATKDLGIRIVTCYHAVSWQCDSTPDVGAYGQVANNGVPLYDNTFACNFLPAGSRIIIPEYSGTKIWVCRDRMASKFSQRIDLLLPKTVNVGLKRMRVYEAIK